MAEFNTVSANEAPKPARPQVNVARIAEYDSYVTSIAPGDVGKLAPTGEETPRMLTHRVAWAAKRANVPIKSWVVDGVVYFELTSGGNGKAKRKAKELVTA